MKTKTILMLCLLIGITWTQISAQKSSKEKEFTMLGEPSSLQEKMNGKVQKVVLKGYWTTGTVDDIKKGRPITTLERDSLNWFYDFEATFDNIGDHIINYITLDDNNKPFDKYQFLRENGQIVSSKWTFGKNTNLNGLEYSKGDGYSKFTYDEKGYLIGAADYSSVGDLLLYTFKGKNNEAGDQIELQVFDNKENLLWKWTSIYNEKRQYIGGQGTDKFGTVTGSNKCSYNDKGKVSEWTNFDKDKNVTVVHKFTYHEYDAKGNWLKWIYKNSSGQSCYFERTITYF